MRGGREAAVPWACVRAFPACCSVYAAARWLWGCMQIPSQEKQADKRGNHPHLLQRLRKGLVLADVCVRHGAARKPHALLKVGHRDAGHCGGG